MSRVRGSACGKESLKRRLFTFFSALSLTLCVLAGALWIESYRHQDFVQWRLPRVNGGKTIVRIAARIARGGLDLCGSREDWESPKPRDVEKKWAVGREAEKDMNSLFFFKDAQHFLHRTFGFGHRVEEFNGGSNYFPHGWIRWRERDDFISVPVRALGGAFIFLPFAWMMRLRRNQRWRANFRCMRCGYDLRASLERCPECGTVPRLAKA